MPFSNPEKRREYHKEYLRKWKLNHPGKYKAYHKTHRLAHPEKFKKQSHDDWEKTKAIRPSQICLTCNGVFRGRLNQKYCSVGCREKRHYKIRQHDENHIAKSRERDKIYYYKKGKSMKLAYQKKPKFREHQNQWRKEKKPWIKEYANNPEAHREKTKRFRKTLKGKINDIKCNERRRKKNLFMAGHKYEEISKDLFQFILERDKVCVYCHCEFVSEDKTRRATIDHLNPSRPLSADNAVRCCQSCNSSKRDVPIDKMQEWLDSKGLKPADIVTELSQKQLEK